MKYLLALLAISFHLESFCSSVNLEWEKEPVSDSYTVSISSEGITWYQEGITNTFTTITNLQAGTLHSFRVFGVNQYGNGPDSDTISVVVSDEIQVDIPEINPPTGLSLQSFFVSVGSTWAISVKWNSVSNAIGYKVSSSDGLNSVDMKTTSKSAQIPKMPYGTTNIIVVTSFDALGNESLPSEPMTVVVDQKQLGVGVVQYNSVFQLPSVKPQ